MDMLALNLAKKYSEKLVNDASMGNVQQLIQDVDELITDAEIINQDGDLASELILIKLRQHIWQNEEDALVCETGTVTLSNTLAFPFNDSKATVALTRAQANTDYAVIAWTESEAGNIGEIQITEKQVNGFKASYSGSAKTATIKYIVIGGIIK